jgi:hypothetical protein
MSGLSKPTVRLLIWKMCLHHVLRQGCACMALLAARWAFPSLTCINLLSISDAHWLYNWSKEGDWVYVSGPSAKNPTDPKFHNDGGSLILITQKCGDFGCSSFSHCWSPGYPAVGCAPGNRCPEKRRQQIPSRSRNLRPIFSSPSLTPTSLPKPTETPCHLRPLRPHGGVYPAAQPTISAPCAKSFN